MDFNHWVKSKRPCRNLDWQERFDDGGLVVKVAQGGIRRYYELTRLELEFIRMGWRWVVARAIRKCRKEIRHKREEKHRAAMAEFSRNRMEVFDSDFGRVSFLRHHYA